MARGDMPFTTKTYGDVEILNRKNFEAIPMTIDASALVKAGTPINASGVPVTATPWTGAYGILLYDVDPKVNPQGTIVKKGFLNKGRIQAHLGSAITLDGKLPTVLNTMGGCQINFEDPVLAQVAL